MDTEYGTVIYMGETTDLTPIYVYEIRGIFVKSAILDGKPYTSMIKTTKMGRQYFTKAGSKVYLDELEEVNVI